MGQPGFTMRAVCSAAIISAGIGLVAAPTKMPLTPMAWFCAGPLIGAGAGTLFRRPLFGVLPGVPAPIAAVIVVMIFLTISMGDMLVSPREREFDRIVAARRHG